MKILVVGENGQLARALKPKLPSAEFWGSNQLNWLNTVGVAEMLLQAAPDIIVNATAYTAVDKAQTEPQAAWAVNAEGPRILAEVAASLGARLIHISTDYVFDGQSTADYLESDATHPINVYGATKLAGELAVSSICTDHIIIRTSWVFSENGSNFVHTMLRLGSERESLSIVNDQIGRPTYAGDLANAIERAGNKSELKPGIYHLSGGGACSWYDFAVEIFAQARERDMIVRVPELSAIPTKNFPTPAARPLRCVLAPSSGLTKLLKNPPDWREGLATVLNSLGV